MKLNIKALQLVEKGLSTKTVSKLTESQINVLHNKLVVNEQVVTKTTTSYEIPAADVEKGVTLPKANGKLQIQKTNTGIKATPVEENEIDETETDDVTDQDALGKDALQDYTGQEAPHDANDMGCDGMDDDSCNDRKMMGMAEGTKAKRKKREQNPWAICTAQLGKEFKTTERHLWNTKQKNKYERCVKDVKKSLKEGKNPVSLFIENQIMKIVEKNLPPRITKGDLLKYITEGPATAPSKPAPDTKPRTKPGKPDTRPRPKHPGQRPKDVPNPAPKAAKEEVINIIMNLLEK